MTVARGPRLVVVLGKGGVGRTTLACALAVQGALAGLRTCVAEFGDGAAAEALGLSGRSFAFREGTAGVAAWSLTVEECLEEFARRKLHLPGFARGVLHAPQVRTFVDAIPGLGDLLLLGKIENLISEPVRGDPVFDTIFLDAPATGHGITLLQAANTLTDLARAGPFHDLAARIRDFLGDPARTAMVLVTLPEELPATETVELAAALRAEGWPPARLVVNRVDRFPVADPARLAAALEAIPDGGALARLIEARRDRAARQAEAIGLLRDALGDVPVTLAPRVGPGDRVTAIAERLR